MSALDLGAVTRPAATVITVGDLTTPSGGVRLGNPVPPLGDAPSSGTIIAQGRKDRGGVLEGTINRTAANKMMAAQREMAETELPEGVELPDVIDIGLEEHLLTHIADVSSVAVRKREALRHHRSQVADDHWFLAMPEDTFVAALGTEWFRAHGPVDDEGSPLHGIVVPFRPTT